MAVSPFVSNLIGFNFSGRSVKQVFNFPMWFIVQILISIDSHLENDLMENYNIKFTSDHMLQTGWYQLYLSNSQYEYLVNNRIANIYPIQKKEKYIKMNTKEKLGDYIVRSIPNWTTKVPIESQITSDIYIVRNISKSVLMKDPQVLSANKLQTLSLRNRYVNGNLQSGKTQVEFDKDYVRIPTPLWNYGIDGKGQVINVIDTGCDVFNPMFYDSYNSVPINTTNEKHRKVVRYDALADSTDNEDGHGTHVAGTALGKPECQDCGLVMYRGVAPEAKLYFVDFADSKTLNITVYPNMTKVVEHMREVKAKISSNSWGIAGVNLQNTHAFDKLAYENPDILFLIAAGNSGQYRGGELRYMSIESPADGKNVLCVGNVADVSGQSVEKDDMRQYLFYDSENSNNYVNVEVSQFGKDIWKETEKNYKVWISNSTVVDHNSDNINNNVFVYTGGTAGLCDSIKKAMQNKPSAIVVPILQKTCVDKLKGQGIKPEDHFIFTNLRADARDTLSKMKKTTLQITSYSEKGLEMRGSSSKGETIYGISKPDVSAIGTNVISAKAGNFNQKYFRGNDYKKVLSEKTGTSMSTPAVAGAAALIRQYFEDEKYPTNKQSTDVKSNQKIDPSAILLKGILVNSATKITGFGSDPSIFDGYGIPNLEYGLGFLDGVKLNFVDNVDMPSKTHHIYKISASKASNTYDLQITLVYNDPPVEPSKSYRFYADLNLYVESPNGQKVYYGNDSPFDDADYFASIEKVIITNRDIEEGEYKIHVVSSEYPNSEKVNYTIVVNGPTTSTLEKDTSSNNNNNCPNSCGNNGNCINGRCQCSNNYYGNKCHKSMKLFSTSYREDNMRNKDVRYSYHKVVGSVSSQAPLKVHFRTNSKYGNATFCYMKTYGRLADKTTTCTDKTPLIISDTLSSSDTIYFATYVPAPQFDPALVWADIERTYSPGEDPKDPPEPTLEEEAEPYVPVLPVIPENPVINPQTPNPNPGSGGGIPTIPQNGPGSVPDDGENDDNKGLGGGAIAGIVIGSVAVVGAGVGAAYFVFLRKPHTPVENIQMDP